LEQAGKPVKSLELLHEKLMHLIVVRNDLGEFQHLHPVVSDDGHASIDLQLPTAGHYWIYLDAQPRGGAQQTARNELHLAGDAPAAAELAVNVPGKVSAGELSTEISLTKAGSEWMITFSSLARRLVNTFTPIRKQSRPQMVLCGLLRTSTVLELTNCGASFCAMAKSLPSRRCWKFSRTQSWLLLRKAAHFVW
jgi:hypothetical protein